MAKVPINFFHKQTNWSRLKGKTTQMGLTDIYIRTFWIMAEEDFGFQKCSFTYHRVQNPEVPPKEACSLLQWHFSILHTLSGCWPNNLFYSDCPMEACNSMLCHYVTEVFSNSFNISSLNIFHLFTISKSRMSVVCWLPFRRQQLSHLMVQWQHIMKATWPTSNLCFIHDCKHRFATRHDSVSITSPNLTFDLLSPLSSFLRSAWYSQCFMMC